MLQLKFYLINILDCELIEKDADSVILPSEAIFDKNADWSSELICFRFFTANDLTVGW